MFCRLVVFLSSIFNFVISLLAIMPVFLSLSEYNIFINILSHALLLICVFLILLKQFDVKVLFFSAFLLVLLLPGLYSLLKGYGQLDIVLFGWLDFVKGVLPLFLILNLSDSNFERLVKGGLFQKFVTPLIIGYVAIGVTQFFFPESIGLLFPGYDMDYRDFGVRVPSVLGNPNTLSKFAILLLIPFLLKKNILGFLALTAVVFVITFSRNFLLLAIFGLILYYVYAVRKALRMGFFFLALLMLSGATLFVDISAFYGGSDGGFRIPENYLRLAVAYSSVHALLENPLGLGLGFFGGNIGKDYAFEYFLVYYGIRDIFPFFDFSRVYTDTFFFESLGSLGLFWLVIVFLLFRRLSFFYRDDRSKLIVMFFSLVLLVLSFSGPITNYYWFTIPVFVVFRLVIARRFA